MRRLLPLTALLLLVASCQNTQPPQPPAPTEHRLEEHAEAENREHRLAWVEEMHRTAPDVDWREIERENGLVLMQQRMQARNNPLQRSSYQYGVWRELGSRNQAGRMHAVQHSTDGTGLVAGSSRGGIWLGGLDGSNWRPIGDNLFGGSFELAVIPGLPNQPDIYLRLAGSMIHRTTNEGVDWVAPDGLSSVSDSGRVLVLKDPGHTILLVARRQGGPGGSQWSLFRSTDRGESFQRVRDMGSYRADIWTPRDRLDSVFLVQQDQVYESTDLGTTWNAVGIKIPAAATGRSAVFSGHENPVFRFNIAIDVPGSGWELWRSPDGGQSWLFRRVLTDFWQSLESSSVNGGLLAYAGVEMYVSRDGGANFQKVNNWGEYYSDPANKLHADVPGLAVVPDAGGEIWYVCTDGGLYRSLDMMNTVENLSLVGLGVSQYYSTHTSRRKPEYVLAGAQDQGYQRAQLGTPGTVPGPWADFDQLISGDYGHMTSGDGSHDFVYSCYPGFILVQDGEDNPRLRFVDFPPNERYAWIPYIQADPLDKEAFYFCGRYLYRYKKSGATSWNHVQHSGFDFGPSGAYLSAVVVSPHNPQRMYAATNNGGLFYSNDGGINWTASADTGPGGHYLYGAVLLPSSTEPDTVYVGGSGYSTAGVKVSRDGGVSWQAMRDGLPNTMVYGLVEAPDQSGVLFAACETGAWMYQPGIDEWTDALGFEAPITTYWSVETVPSQNIVRFGTYGRGIWDYEIRSAGFFPYGESLGGPHILELSSISSPAPGQTLQFSVQGGPANAVGFLGVSTADASVPFRGGTLLIDRTQATIQSFSTDNTGLGWATFTLPNDPALIGQDRYFQAVIRDNSQAAGWSFSHGLRARIGS